MVISHVKTANEKVIQYNVKQKLQKRTNPTIKKALHNVFSILILKKYSLEMTSLILACPL